MSHGMPDGGSETQQMLAQAVEQMLERHPSVSALCEGQAKPDLWAQVAEIGLVAAEFEEDRGGLGVPFADIAPAMQKIGRALATTNVSEFATIGGWLVGACNAPDTEHLVAMIAAGEARVALAHGEYGSGGDVAFTMSNTVQFAGGWTIEGRKSVVVGGDRATHLIVPAMLSGGEDGAEAELGLFLVPADAAGLLLHVLGIYDGSTAADFDLRGVEVPPSSLLARGARATDLVELALDRGRAALCHEAVGLLEKVHEVTLEYVKLRKQFGQPIGAFQTMQHRMAEMYMDVELSRSCAEMATDAISYSSDTHARIQTVSAAMVSMCEIMRRVGQSAVQAHGGIALTREYPVGHYFKRLTMLERYLGNAEHHLERFIAHGVARLPHCNA